MAKIIDVKINSKGEGETMSVIDKLIFVTRSFFTYCKEKITDGIRWIYDNRSIIIDFAVFAAEAIASIYILVKPFLRNKQEKHDYRVRHEYYDPSTGLHWKLKRELRNYEREEIDRRRRAGEPVGQILRSMRVLAR